MAAHKEGFDLLKDACSPCRQIGPGPGHEQTHVAGSQRAHEKPPVDLTDRLGHESVGLPFAYHAQEGE